MKANAILVQIASDCQWRNRLITAGHAHRSNVLLIQPLGCRYRNLFGSRTSLADCTAQLMYLRGPRIVGNLRYIVVRLAVI